MILATAPFSVWMGGSVATFTNLYAKVLLIFVAEVPDFRLPLRLHALLERVHDVDDFRSFTLFSLDLDLRRTLLDLGLDKFVNCLGILVRHLLGLKLPRLLLNEIYRERYRVGIGVRLDGVEIGFRLS